MEVVDFGALAAGDEYGRPLWASRCEDLNVNFSVLRRGEQIEEHVNALLDVLFVALSGEARMMVDGHEVVLCAGQGIIVPRGASRSLRATSERFGYLSVHRQRGGLWPQPPQRRE
jgi:mannose-6-phosphate isomerase-like protein (cupin superfamily)